MSDLRHNLAALLTLGDADFIATATERMAEATAMIAEYPAEETPFSGEECNRVAARLVGDDDLPLQFAVFCALLERSAS